MIMSEKMAFVYAHGGPVLDDRQPDGLNERGRNIAKSIRSAVVCGADKVFVSESLAEGNSSQFEILFKKGLFSGIEQVIDFQHYPIAKNVKFPKNYLMNRSAQRANGFFGMVFSDSDVIFQKDFPARAAAQLRSYEFVQPEYVMYTDPQGNDEYHIETSMKRAVMVEDLHRSNLSYLEGMPGMVNVARRDTFLQIGGFSQAMSGVNFEDIEYQIRIRLLGKSTSFMQDEWCRHLYHSRSSIARQSENLPNMYFDNANFMNWFVDNYIQINGSAYNTENFRNYMKIILASFSSNGRETYTNETGTITHMFDPNRRYAGWTFGSAEPYVEYGTAEEQIIAVINAASFWRISYQEVMKINPPWKLPGITINDVLAYVNNKRSTVEDEQIHLPELRRIMHETVGRKKTDDLSEMRRIMRRQLRESEGGELHISELKRIMHEALA